MGSEAFWESGSEILQLAATDGAASSDSHTFSLHRKTENLEKPTKPLSASLKRKGIKTRRTRERRGDAASSMLQRRDDGVAKASGANRGFKDKTKQAVVQTASIRKAGGVL